MFTEFDHRQGVVAAPVVACDDVKILRASDVGGRCEPVLQHHQRQWSRVFQSDTIHHGALGYEGAHIEGGHDVGRQQFAQVFGRGHHFDGVVRGHAGLPAKSHEVIRHRTDHIHGAVDQVDVAVAVEIHRVATPAAGNELRPAHGAGVAAT